MSSSLISQMLINQVPSGYLPSNYQELNYTFPFLYTYKGVQEETPYTTIQVKAMYHRLKDAIHGLVFDVDTSGFPFNCSTTRHNLISFEYFGHIELPQHNELLSIFASAMPVQYFQDKIAQAVMQYQDEIIDYFCTNHSDSINETERGIFESYKSHRKDTHNTYLTPMHVVTGGDDHNHSLLEVVVSSSYDLHTALVSQLVKLYKLQNFNLKITQFEWDSLFIEVSP